AISAGTCDTWAAASTVVKLSGHVRPPASQRSKCTARACADAPGTTNSRCSALGLQGNRACNAGASGVCTLRQFKAGLQPANSVAAARHSPTKETLSFIIFMMCLILCEHSGKGWTHVRCGQKLQETGRSAMKSLSHTLELTMLADFATPRAPQAPAEASTGAQPPTHDLLAQVGEEVAGPLTRALELVTILSSTGRIDRAGLR